jgi:hypothetical protein
MVFNTTVLLVEETGGPEENNPQLFIDHSTETNQIITFLFKDTEIVHLLFCFSILWIFSIPRPKQVFFEGVHISNLQLLINHTKRSQPDLHIFL